MGCSFPRLPRILRGGNKQGPAGYFPEYVPGSAFWIIECYCKAWILKNYEQLFTFTENQALFEKENTAAVAGNFLLDESFSHGNPDGLQGKLTRYGRKRAGVQRLWIQVLHSGPVLSAPARHVARACAPLRAGVLEAIDFFDRTCYN